MAITTNYILMCDDVRREDNGKLMVLGLYPVDMTIQQIPAVLPSLTFFCNLSSDRPGTYRVSVKLRHEESGRAAGEALAAFPILDPRGPIIAPIKFSPVQLNSAGLYSFSLEIEGQQPLVHTFNVQLVIPGAQPGMTSMGR